MFKECFASSFLNDLGYNLTHLIVSTHNFPLKTSAEVEHLCDEIVKQRGNKNICFDGDFEGLQIGMLKTINDVCEILISKYGVNLKSIIWITTADPIRRNVDAYKEYIKTTNYHKITVLFVNRIEKSVALNALSSKRSNIKKLNKAPIKKDKKFLMFNGGMRAHRAYLLAYIIKNNLLEKGYISLYRSYPTENSQPTEFDIFPKKCWVGETLRKNYKLFPMKLVGDTKQELVIYDIIESETHLYANSYFGVVTETNFFKSENPLSLNWVIDHNITTEKTFKYIFGKLPFIMVGVPGALSALREQGYQTFHPFINESYDEENDDIQRLRLITKEIMRLCRFTNEEWQEFMKNTIPITNHNYKRLLNTETKILKC